MSVQPTTTWKDYGSQLSTTWNIIFAEELETRWLIAIDNLEHSDWYLPTTFTTMITVDDLERFGWQLSMTRILMVGFCRRPGNILKDSCVDFDHYGLQLTMTWNIMVNICRRSGNIMIDRYAIKPSTSRKGFPWPSTRAGWNGKSKQPYLSQCDSHCGVPQGTVLGPFPFQKNIS